jgi:phage terminase large subunit
MLYKPTTALIKIVALKKRIKVIQGGSSAGKTIAIMLKLIDRAQKEDGKTFSVVSETMPHLKRGAIKDFLSIMEGHQYYKDDNWNRTDFIYKFEGGSTIEFFSADTPDKVHGPRRDVLFINECNNVSFETYTQLEIRTNEDIYLDYNPVQEFWVHTDILPKIDCDFLVLTYKDNEGLSPAIVESIESKRSNKYFWSVYGMGELGEVEGKIYKEWNIIPEVPFEAKLKRYGLDFGYTNDPTAIVAIYYYDGGYILEEKLYNKGLSNKQIADNFKNMEQALVVADSAEPKSIDEIRTYGVNIIGALKGKDSVTNGIQWVQDQKISMTAGSVNLIKEYRNYIWKTDRQGKIMQIPEEGFDHLLDAVRYGMQSFKPDQREIVINIQQTTKPSLLRRLTNRNY